VTHIPRRAAAAAGTILALVLLPAAPARAGELELSGWAGPTFPTYQQRFVYEPGAVTLPFPGVAVTQTSAFSLSADGALSLGGGVAFFPIDPVGLEVRLDTADIDVRVTGARYNVSVDLPAPLPDFTTGIDLTSGAVDVKRIHPVSFNLKLRTPGHVRFFVSGGASYLPSLEATVAQTVALGATGFTPPSSLQVGTLGLRAEAVPADGYSQWGLNGGAGFQFQVAHRISLTAEARYFHFDKRTLVWSRADDRNLSGIEQTFLAQVLQRLPTVSFDPQFWQATGGIAISF
jgi:opacity protein-like surface antigen